LLDDVIFCKESGDKFNQAFDETGRYGIAKDLDDLFNELI
jgi:hypothetical protein